MEFILSSNQNEIDNEIFEDETYCTKGLCAHPCCWSAHIREERGLKKYVSMQTNPLLEGDKSDEDGLPTLKVCNMLDDYGESPKDLYPSKHRGLALHQRKDFMKSRNPPPRSPPAPSPSKAPSVNDIIQPRRKLASLKQIEVQEVFDLQELSQSWESTFVTQPMYIWVPSKPRKKKKKADSSNTLSIEGNRQQIELVGVKDLTNDMIPKQPSSLNVPASYFKNDSKNPLPTGGQPYHNVGQTPKDRKRQRGLVKELKDLPRPFVLEVLEKTKRFETKEELLLIMEKYLQTMNKSDWEMSMVTSQVLQQKRIDLSNVDQQIKPNSRLHPIPQVYKLDDYKEFPDQAQLLSPPSSARLTRQATTTESKKRKKKTPIRVHVTPSAADTARPFQYSRQQRLGFCLGPAKSASTVPSRPNSEKLEAKTPSDGGELTAGVEIDDMVVLYDTESVKRNINNNNNNASELKSLTPRRENSQQSKDIPKAPAATPYTPTTPHRDIDGRQPDLQPVQDDEGALGVIQEAPVHEEKPMADTKAYGSQIQSDGYKKLPTKRIISAQLPKVEYQLEARRSLSAGAMHNTANDLKAQQLYASQLEQAEQQVGSNVDILSTTSQWPLIDEEQILREATAEELVKTEEEQPKSDKQVSPEMDTREAEMKSPAPPPPSPEPKQSRKNQTSQVITIPTDSKVEDADAETNATLSDSLTELQPEKDQATYQVDQIRSTSDSQNQFQPQKDTSLISLPHGEKDPLTIIPDEHEYENDRDVSLSALPPSCLDTPDICTVPDSKPEAWNQEVHVQEPQEMTLPAVDEIMRQDDQGGLSGQT